MEDQALKSLEGPVGSTPGVEGGYQRVQGSLAGKVAPYRLVLLGVEILGVVGALGLVFPQFIARVDAVAGDQRASQYHPQGKRGDRPVAEHPFENVGRVRPEVRAHLLAGRARRQLGQVLGQLGPAGPPGEVSVALAETNLTQAGHHGRSGEGLGQEEHLGVAAANRSDHPGPKGQRLGMGVVDPEDGHAPFDPMLENLQAGMP